jgi:hypothetical protein
MTRPAGWRKEPARHALAAKGVKTKAHVQKTPMPISLEDNGPTDEEANQWAWDHYQQHWNGLGSKEMDEFYEWWESAHSKGGSGGMVRYCGYVVGRGVDQITPEQMERLFHFIHANYTQTELIMMRDKQLHEIAEDSEEEWRY